MRLQALHLALSMLILAVLPDAGLSEDPPAASNLTALEEFYAGGDLQGAIDEGERLLAGQLTAEERVTALNYLGACCYLLARYDDAVSYIERALAELQAPDGALRASLLNDLGECQRAAGEFADAERTLELALSEVVSAQAQTELHARILNNIAGLYRDRGNFAKTEELLREALRITENAENVSGDRLATAHLNLAELLRFQSRLEESRPFYEAALETARTAYPEQHTNLVFFLNQFAVLESSQGRFDSAKELREEALQILAAQNVSYPILQAMLVSDSANDLAAQERPQAARALYEEALGLRQSTYSDGHWELGANLAQLARVELESGAVEASNIIARASTAIDILDRTPVAPESRADAYAVRGLARLRIDDDRARDDLDRAIRIVEELRVTRGGGHESRAKLLARYSSYYDEAIHLALESGSVELALMYSERFRARALAEQLLLDEDRMLAAIDEPDRSGLQAQARIAQTELVSLQDAMVQLAYDPGLSGEDRAAELVRLQSELESAARAYAASQERIRARSPAWQRMVRESNTVSLEDVKLLIAKNERLLLFWVGPAHGWLIEIAAAPAPPRAHRLSVGVTDAAALGLEEGDLTLADLSAVLVPSERGFGAGPLFESVRGVSETVDLPDSTTSAGPTPPVDATARLHALKNVLLPGGVWDRIQSSVGITILPAGPLHLLPFEALVVEPSTEEPRYWLDAGPPIRYANSASTLRQLAMDSQAPREYGNVDLLSVSNPALVSSETGLPPLPGTTLESNHLQAAFGHERVEVLSGEQATESAFRSRCSDRRYLHLATHGVVDEATSDVLAGLILAREDDAERGDGRLQLYEIDRLRLSAQLAVLSACRTGAGKRIEGEGVFALARGFHVAGALRVVASLWSVSDASTASLMGGFFDRLARAEREGRPIEYAQALHEAKQAVRAHPQWSAPFYWAPFLLSGTR